MATKKKNAPHPVGQVPIHSRLPEHLYDELRRYTEASGLIIRREIGFAVRHWLALSSTERQKLREKIGLGDMDENNT